MNDSPEEPTKTQPRAKRRGPRFFWLLAGLMAGMVLIVELPNQWLAWKLAAALEAREAGDKARANQMLDELLQKRPDDEQYQTVRYMWNKEDGKYEEALQFLNKQLASAPEGTERFGALIMDRSQVYLHLGRHSEAVADCLELVRLNEKIGRPERQQVLNLLAYTRALAGTDLEAALADADAAVAIARADLKEAETVLQAAIAKKKRIFEANEQVAAYRSSLLACLDTRGVVRFKQQDFAAAERDFEEAVQYLEQVREFYRVYEKQFTTQVREYKSFAKKQKEQDHSYAVIYYHRSLNLKELGRDEDAERDWQKARKLLGREPDETLF